MVFWWSQRARRWMTGYILYCSKGQQMWLARFPVVFLETAWPLPSHLPHKTPRPCAFLVFQGNKNSGSVYLTAQLIFVCHFWMVWPIRWVPFCYHSLVSSSNVCPAETHTRGSRALPCMPVTDRTLSSAATLGQGEPGSNDNEEVLQDRSLSIR